MQKNNMAISHRWQEMKYFWHRSFVITTSADRTLLRKPAEVPTMFLSLQNLATSLVEMWIYPLHLSVKDFVLPVGTLDGVKLTMEFRK